MSLIGQNIKRFRDRANLSQEQVALFLDKKREQIAYYENGSREPSLDDLNRMSDLFGIELSTLLEEDEDFNQVDVAMAFRANDLTTDDLKQISGFQKIVKNYLKLKRIHDGQG